MDIEIIDDPIEAVRYVDQVRSLADQNTEALGFLPESAYTDAALKGHLWIAADKAKHQILGYLLFGGTFPNIRIFQIYVCQEFRGQNIAPALIQKLMGYGQKHNFMNIKAKVASELRANKFWQEAGFEIIDQFPGKTAGRINNLYCLELDVPSLFRESKSSQPSANVQPQTKISLSRPILESPTYVIDVNVLFDVIRNRNADETALIFTSAMNNDVKLRVTHEFIRELEGKSLDPKNDPVLSFAIQLPRLPELNDEITSPIIAEIREVFLSGTPKTGKRLANDQSDFTHLASCIHHKVHGFITRDGQILRNADEIYRKYSLRIYSPIDVIESYEEETELDKFSAKYSVEEEEIVFSDLRESKRKSIECFLDKLGVEPNEISACLDPGAVQSSRTRLIARSDEKIIGVCSWSNDFRFNRENIVYLYIDENQADSNGVIDHFLQSSTNAGSCDRLICVDLMILSKQNRSLETAIKKGFQPIEDQRLNYRKLRKITINGVVYEKTWNQFSSDFRRSTALDVPVKIPAYNVLKNTGVVAKGRDGQQPIVYTLFDFESLISPAHLVSAGRPAIIVPIKESYANELLTPTVPPRQSSFLASREAALRLERAYFSRTANQRIVRGAAVIFYVSSPRMEAVAMARVTFSETLTIPQALIKLRRQGVLTERVMKKLSDRKGRIFAFTFDNLLAFRNYISYRELKKMGCIGGANLVRAQPVSYQQFRKIVDKGFE